MAAIEMTGLASGMDTKSIVKQLMEIERRPIYLKQDQIQKAQTEKKQWEEIGKQVKSFKTTAMDMNTNNPFRKKIADISDEKVLGVELGPTARKGTFVLEDVKLAKSGTATSDGKIAFDGGADYNITSGKLGIRGVNTKFIDMFLSPIGNMEFEKVGFKINGKEVNVQSTDTLGTFINKINSSGAGVKATFDSAERRFRIESTTSKPLEMDAENKDFLRGLEISKFAGKKVENLVEPDYKKTIGSLDSLDNVKRGFFTINDYTVDVNTETDSVQDVVEKLNKNGSPVKAYFDGVSGKMSIVAATAGDDLIFQDDTSGLMKELGFMKEPEHGNRNKATVYEGQKASFTMDGIKYERDSNEITLDGIKINLKSNTAEGEKVTIKVDHDIDGMVEKIKKFVDDYNATTTLLNAKTGKDAPLQGDTTANNLSNNLRTYMASSVNGIESKFSQLALIGIGTIGKEPELTVNEEKLRAALAENPTEIEKLFVQMGNGKGNEKISNGDGARTKFFSNNYNVTDINNIQIKVGEKIYRADDSKYRIMKKSDLSDLKVSKVDLIKHVINGEIKSKADLDAALGKGVPQNVAVIDDVTGAIEFGNAPDKGESITIESNKKLSNSAYGFNEGITNKINNYLQPMVTYNGTLDRQAKAIDNRITQMNDWISKTEDRLKMREDALKSQFTSMEGSIQNSNSTSNWLSGQIAQLGG
ncbi:MAG: flagellar filament capping protein FliD [Fusobacteriaceae bacterium]|nr:flagellar filament capping protein FliD [Fusobacteriaceae bacterium]MBP6467990.1 flagellar filament capping protein FliD [Fusobacteriaceae bacterium]MBU9917869.1 flagellar filament capping protein FliD [Fusobacteriaceae bacterium]